MKTKVRRLRQWSRDSRFFKVGRIRLSVAKQARIEAADIVIDLQHIVHIGNEHKKELEALNILPEDYVSIIASNFSEIRRGKGSSILLVRVNEDRDDDALAMELTYNDITKYWEVKTAQPRRNTRRNAVLWAKEK